MRNKRIFLSFIIFIAGIVMFNFYKSSETAATVKALSESAIRFHVRANSDSQDDQALKMKVKEKVVDYIYKNTKTLNTLSETKDFILKNDPQTEPENIIDLIDNKIKKLATETIRNSGYDYSVSSSFGMQDFPVKTYGDVTFPKGRYTSYTIYIGEGIGHNWWCVLYPPLCFVDASTGVVPNSSKEMLKESLTEKEYDTVVQYRFKYLTFLNNFIN